MLESGTPQSIPRKRRRPALSCEQCRRRKVRCDREMPCGPCTKSQPSFDCEYVYEGKAALKARVDAFRNSEHESPPPGAQGSNAPSSIDGARIAQLEASVRTLQSRMHDLEQGSHVDAARARREVLTDDSTSSSNANKLDDHIADLERRLAEAKARRSEVPQTCIAPLVPRLKICTADRTKLFGTTHWALVFQQVRFYTRVCMFGLLTLSSFGFYDKCAARPAILMGIRMRSAGCLRKFGL